MKKLLAIAGIAVGASVSVMAQNNVSVYTFKEVAGRIPTATTAAPNTLPLQFPDAVYADKAGNVFITDTGGHKLWKIDPTGKATVILGTNVFGTPSFGKAAAGQPAQAPAGVIEDAEGN